MNRIFQDSEDQHVVATLVYKKTGDAYAYSDAATTVKINAATLKDLFEKGAIVVEGAVEYKPVSFGIASTVGTLTYVKTDGTTATTAVLATLKSSEFVA